MENPARTATHYIEKIHAEAPAQKDSKTENIKQRRLCPRRRYRVV